MKPMTYHFGRATLSEKFQHANTLLGPGKSFNPSRVEFRHDGDAAAARAKMLNAIDEVTTDILTDHAVLHSMDGVDGFEQLAVNHNLQGIDPNVFGKVLEARGYIVRDAIDKDREPLHMLDFFESQNLINDLTRGQSSVIWQDRGWKRGDVRLIADCVKDLPAVGGGRPSNWNHAKVEKFGNHVEVNICDVWDRGAGAAEWINQMYQDALMSQRYFFDQMLKSGSPKHGLYGLLEGDKIDMGEVVPGKGDGFCDELFADTAWVNKTPAEIIFDIACMLDFAEYKVCFNDIMPTLWLPRSLKKLFGVPNATPEGKSIQKLLDECYPDLDIRYSVCMDTAGPPSEQCPEGTPAAMVGEFRQSNIEVHRLNAIQMPRIEQGMCWRVPIIGAMSSVICRRANRFCLYGGIGAPAPAKKAKAAAKAKEA